MNIKSPLQDHLLLLREMPTRNYPYMTASHKVTTSSKEHSSTGSQLAYLEQIVADLAYRKDFALTNKYLNKLSSSSQDKVEKILKRIEEAESLRT